jgi:hypothetical protein
MRLLTSILLSTGLYHPLRRWYFRIRRLGKDPQQIFGDIYSNNRWQGSESRSGEGSSIGQTREIAAALPGLLRRIGATSMLDIPCGDFHWMSGVELQGIDYTGADLVPSVVAEVASRWQGPGRSFRQLDLCSSPLPGVGLVFCRDCLVHLPIADIRRAIANIQASGSEYLLATTFPGTTANHDIAMGDFRPLNLQRPPFNFPEPLETILERCTEASGAHSDKSMALWKVSSLPDMRAATT